MGLPPGTTLAHMQWAGVPAEGYADTGGPVVDLAIGEAPPGGRLDLLSLIRAHLGFMIPPAHATIPDDPGQLRRLLLHDLHWEALAAAILPGDSDMVEFVPVADLPSLEALRLQVVGTRDSPLPVVLPGALSLSRAGEVATFGAWVMDHGWTELLVRNRAAHPNVTYQAVGNWSYKQVAQSQALRDGTTVLEAWGFTQNAKVGNVYEYAAGQWALAGKWEAIRTLLKAIACLEDGAMGQAHRRALQGTPGGWRCPPGRPARCGPAPAAG